MVTKTGHLFKLVHPRTHTCTDIWWLLSTYGSQAGGTHRTAMFPCFKLREGSFPKLVENYIWQIYHFPVDVRLSSMTLPQLNLFTSTSFYKSGLQNLLKSIKFTITFTLNNFRSSSVLNSSSSVETCTPSVTAASFVINVINCFSDSMTFFFLILFLTGSSCWCDNCLAYAFDKFRRDAGQWRIYIDNFDRNRFCLLYPIFGPSFIFAFFWA